MYQYKGNTSIFNLILNMTTNENIFNLLKKETQNSLLFYNKVIPETNLTLEQLIDKASEIDKKITTNKTNMSEIGVDLRFSEKVSTMNEAKTGNTQYIDFDAYKKENPYIPKIHLFRQKEKKKKNKDRDNSKKENYKWIMSNKQYSNLELSLIPQIIEKEYNFEEPKEKKLEKEPERRHLKNYDKTLDPFFFTNRYIEYIYEDKGDKLYDETDIIRNLFEKNAKKNLVSDLYLSNQNSPCLQTCMKLTELEKQELEEENKEYLKNDQNTQEIPTLTNEDVKKLQEYLTMKGNVKYCSIELNDEGQPVKVFKTPESSETYKKKIEQPLNDRLDKEKAKLEKSKNKNNDDEKQKKVQTFGRTSEDISFKIEVQGEITKKIRGNPKKEHPRGMIIKGPIAKWYRLNEEKEFEKEKGHFDIRLIMFDEGSLEKEITKNNNSLYVSKDDNNESGIKTNNYDIINKNSFELQNRKSIVIDDEEEFVVKKVIENGKLNDKPTTFSSRRIVEFKNKTFKHFFQQLQNYFKDFYNNIENATYSVLKFLSDTSCTSLDISYDINTNLINYIYWHPNLLSLSIKTSLLRDLANCIKSTNWECRLETLTITKGSSSSDLENNLSAIFSSQNSISIQNIHFIDIMYTDGIKEALKKHIDTFYGETVNDNLPKDSEDDDDENVNYLRKMRLCDYKNNTIPILNLSIKRSAIMGENNKSSDEIVDLKSVYHVFMYMLYHALKYNKGTVPEVFNLLDLSEQTVKNERYLVKIITKFKLIKELNISNTKIETSGKLIESSSFLRNIKLTPDLDNNIEQCPNEDLYLKYQKYGQEGDSNQSDDSSNDLFFDFSLGVYPLLETIYLYNTELKEDVSKEIYALFKRLKFFRGVYYSSPVFNNTQDGNIGTNTKTIERLIEEMHKDKKTYCENVFMITNNEKEKII